MTTICIFSGRKSDSLVRTLLSIFRTKRVLLWREGIGRNKPPLEERADVVILQNPDCRVIPGRCLLIFQQYGGPLPELEWEGNVAVVDSADEKSQEVLKNCGLHTATCGFLSKDMATLSGVADDSLTVSLQRSIPSLYGRTLEPRDIVFPLEEGRDRQGALLAVLAGILCEML